MNFAETLGQFQKIMQESFGFSLSELITFWSQLVQVDLFICLFTAGS